MDDIYIDLRTQNRWIQEAFDFEDAVSIGDLLGKIEDLLDDLKEVKQEFEEFKSDVADNYKYIPLAEQVDISDRDFI